MLDKDNGPILISVIMGIYNCQETLSRAIDSILTQTYSHWELVMCDDGSTDNTYQIANRYKEMYPEKIILLKNNVNQGLSPALNKCLRASKGGFVARQDADDVSLPIRFEKEANYLLSHPDCAFVSCGMYVHDGTKRIGLRIQKRIKPDAKGFMKRNQFFHAPVMIRREALETVNGYSEDSRLLRVEDYNLWTKLYAAGFHGENIQEAYYEVLENDKTYKRRKFKTRINGAYATLIAVDMLKLPLWYKIFALRGLVIGILPTSLYQLLHRKRLSKMNKQQ